ncbi:MAG TPA: DUF2378 family protein [Myxococcaceae bacterium]|nr:DUF2378 family protein [Myxococcaceae bacterium]
MTFGTAFEGLFRAYGPVLTEAALQRLLELGLDPRKPFQAGYPADLWHQTVRILAEEQHPVLGDLDGTREVGRAFMRGYMQTTLGRSTFAMLRVLGTLRSLKRMSRNFRTGDNFTETWLHEDAPGDVRLELNHTEVPAFIQGMLEQGLTGVGAQDSSVELLTVPEQENTVYRIRWKA